jgi:hypothetical protein
MGYFSSTPIDYKRFLDAITSFVISDTAKYSASVDDKVTLFPDFDFHETAAPQKYRI